MSIQQTKLSALYSLSKIRDEGYVCVAEEGSHIPFPIKRVYFIYDVIHNAVRGRHAHKKTKQLLFCIQGSITIILDNGSDKEAITLHDPSKGILLDAMMWHEMVGFKKNTILLVLASHEYTESDYIRNYKDYLKEVSA